MIVTDSHGGRQQETDAGLTRHPSFYEAFKFWLRLGFISFGGPARSDFHHAPGAGGGEALGQQ